MIFGPSRAAYSAGIGGVPSAKFTEGGQLDGQNANIYSLPDGKFGCYFHPHGLKPSRTMTHDDLAKLKLYVDLMYGTIAWKPI